MKIEARPIEVIETTVQCPGDLGECSLVELAMIFLAVMVGAC